MKTIRIGNGAGFWGDSLDAPRLLAEAGRLDYLTLEYLAELTMSILAHQKSRDPQAGYVTDFPVVLESLVPLLKDQPDLRIVTNAGGMNPAACARHAAQILSDAGLDALPIGVATGDDLLADFDAHLAAGERFVNLETGRPLAGPGAEVRGQRSEVRDQKSEVRDQKSGMQSPRAAPRGNHRTTDNEQRTIPVVSANAYLGAAGIVEALARGARIVITGRVADASLAVGPAVHDFGWKWDDWDRLATATVAGHLIECGAQMTGGMYSEWRTQTEPGRAAPDRNRGDTPGLFALADVGYPIAELSEDGSLVVTKPEGTAGAVTTGTVAEQLVYEIGDPAHYLTPDVDADFSDVRLIQLAEDRVAVSGARGNPAPEEYKVSLAREDGYMVSGTLLVAGPGARRKAEACAAIVLERLRRAGREPARTNVECLGAGDSLPGVWPQVEPWEVVLRISAHDPSRETVERLARELAPLVTSGPPGVTGYTGPRPKPHRVLAYWPTTISRSRVRPAATIRPAHEWAVQ